MLERLSAHLELMRGHPLAACLASGRDAAAVPCGQLAASRKGLGRSKTTPNRN